MFTIIQFKLFAVLFSILAINIGAQMDSDNMEPRNQFNPDLTHDLTDNEIRVALSDLSLKDLESLQAFIDSTDNDLNDQENRLANEEYHSYDLDRQEFGNTKDNPDEEDDYIFEPKNTENDLVNYFRRQRNFEKFPLENRRAKRDDQKINTEDEYINQLVNSFPQSEQLNYYNDMESEKSHIRVKRN